ncbi:MAG: M23 family metallopeptidase [Phocaeicola sp.]
MNYRTTFLLFAMACIFTVLGNEPAVMLFSAREKAHLKVKNPALFKECTHFTIELDSLKNEAFSFPLSNAKLISGYATKQRPNHTGLDLKTVANDSIRSVFDGVVRLAKPYEAYGNLIVIRHANGLESVYSHNAKNLVKSGDVVKAGEVIGLVGRTGRATTDHLHLEFRIDGKHINPSWILNVKEESLKEGKLVCTKVAGEVQIKRELTNK